MSEELLFVARTWLMPAEHPLIDAVRILSPARPAKRLGKMGHCYANAFRRSKGDNLAYAEGWALKPGVPIALEHGFCLNDDNEVIDPTWPDASQCAYVGVVIPTIPAALTMLRINCYGVLPNLWLLPDDIRTEVVEGILEANKKGD